jgi:mono/diheme cytochrome c family protein
MNLIRLTSGLLAVVVFLVSGKAAEPERTLVWDSELKEYKTKPGETETLFSFTATNHSAAEIVINEVHPSCGCTVVSMPAQPWKLASGATGKIEAKVDLRGKRGILMKTLTVNSSAGNKNLIFKVTIADPVPANLSPADREAFLRRTQNQKAAGADRQAVFKNDCAVCHVQPAAGKTGRELFDTSCGICHTAAHRASMVPELTGLPNGGNRDYWHAWISRGKEGSLMPAFAKSAGGPLSDEQITSLVDYVVSELRMPKAAPVRRLPPVIGREVSKTETLVPIKAPAQAEDTTVDPLQK